MSDALVETKLLLPRLRRDTVPRPRLAGLLARAREAPVTLLSAPAGFGKSTLLAGWFAGADHPVAWVSLDERDRRLESFWSYVLLALDRAVPGCAAGALTLLGSGQATTETVLSGVVNELSVHDGEVMLALDDYHLADGAEVAAGMTFLVEHLPVQLHLVVSTRADPVLPLSRLRARGELVEIRAADLRFDGDEVAAYLADLGLPGDAVEALEARTEGWVAALQLAVLSLRGRADASAFIDRFAGDDRFVVDYLVDEVLDRQPDDVRRFLLDTSVLRRLTAPLCEAVHAGAPGSGRAMLELLDRQNLFLVPLDDHRRWYRYHHLFGDVLHAHLLQERPDEVRDLHRRASRWFAGHDDVEEAVRHAFEAGDLDTAAELVELAIPDLRRERREDVVRRWADAFPDQVVRDRPVLAMGLVGALMASNEFGDVDRRLREIEERLAGPAAGLVVVDHDERARLPAEIDVFRAGLRLITGDLVGAITHAQRAIATAPAGDDLTTAAASSLVGLASWSSGDIVVAHDAYVVGAAGLTRAGHIADVLGCTLAIADMELALGRLRDADRALRDALALAERTAPHVLRGTADMLVALSRAAWHRDELAAAANFLRRADDLGEGAGLPQNPYRWRVAMARLRAAERDWPAALELLDEAERVYVGDFSPQVHPIHATRARLLAASGDVGAAVAWARGHGVTTDDDLSYVHEYEHVTLARVLLAGHLATRAPDPLRRAVALLDRLLAAAEAGGRAGSVIEIEVLRAQARRTAGDRTAALQALEHAVDLAEPEGWVRFLGDAAPGLIDELRALAGRRPSSSYLSALLTDRAEEPTPAAAGRLLDPLSDRELDVLRLLGSDLDGPAIARELVVSLNTVRTHTKHIYTKLDVNNRRAAINRAHQLGLLGRAARA
jgi:LuxR family transcriptional regulator, maltose regulon positive regulatory protein